MAYYSEVKTAIYLFLFVPFFIYKIMINERQRGI